MSVKRYQPVAQCVEPSYQAQMIEPKVMEFSEGEYVLHSDYARLQAEVERLQNNCDYLDHKLDEEIDKSAMLCGHVMRLTKAGDELLHEWSSGDETDGRNFKKGLVLWNAAKEGKQS